jgi:hypothetical protein
MQMTTVIYKCDPNRLPMELFGDIAPEWTAYSNDGVLVRLTAKGPIQMILEGKKDVDFGEI